MPILVLAVIYFKLEILDINKSLRTTMVIISHDLASILDIADNIVLLDKSKKGILASGTIYDMQNHENSFVRNFFLRQIEK